MHKPVISQEKDIASSGRKILMAAFKLFALQGYSRTSVENIAREASVSKGLIYHYFNSKEDILKQLFSLFRVEMEKQYQWEPSQPPKEVLQSIINISMKFIIQKSQMNRMMIALAIQPEVTESIKNEMEEMRALWLTKMTSVFKKLNYKDPEAEAYFIGAVLDGTAVGCMAMTGSYPTNKMKKLIEQRYGL